jgi:hypothetical protein
VAAEVADDTFALGDTAFGVAHAEHRSRARFVKNVLELKANRGTAAL